MTSSFHVAQRKGAFEGRWALFWDKAVCRMVGEPSDFNTREEVVAALDRHGLKVDDRMRVSVQ